MAKMNKQQFEAGFAPMLERVAGAERVTKAELKEWCNHIVQAMHDFGNIDYMNKLIKVLTPMNKRVVLEFFKHFTGYHLNTDEGIFDKKSKKRYIEALGNWERFSQDPLNNVWTWAERHIQIDVKPFTVEDVAKRASSLWKSAHAANISNSQIIQSILLAKDANGKLAFSLDDVVQALQSLDVEVAAETHQGSVFERGDIRADVAEAML